MFLWVGLCGSKLRSKLGAILSIVKRFKAMDQRFRETQEKREKSVQGSGKARNTLSKGRA